jgi:hypothetical protein
MRLRNERQRNASIEELLQHEAEEHDIDYAGKYAFGASTPKFSKEFAWKISDHVYKRGAYRRGYIKRRLFQ